jgi:hypothetical protein
MSCHTVWGLRRGLYDLYLLLVKDKLFVMTNVSEKVIQFFFLTRTEEVNFPEQ